MANPQKSHHKAIFFSNKIIMIFYLFKKKLITGNLINVFRLEESCDCQEHRIIIYCMSLMRAMFGQEVCINMHSFCSQLCIYTEVILQHLSQFGFRRIFDSKQPVPIRYNVLCVNFYGLLF